ncbi:MAG: hypothetical protein HY540_02665 [Deltaproteobacteria bacterium]|nr:hypothetical protein [Deltaproteobacteria bacterium]
MLVIPQIYLKNGKAIRFGSAKTFLFDEDPLAFASSLKKAGIEAIYVTDLSVPALGASIHLPVIKALHQELNLAVFVGGPFRSQQAIDPYITQARVELVVLGSIIYQQPSFLEEACKRYRARIGVHLDVRGGHVTVPGWAIQAQKTPVEYGEKFRDLGVNVIFYSDTDAMGNMNDQSISRTVEFCKKINMSTVVSSELRGLHDAEQVALAAVPRMEGFLVNKAFYDDLLDLRSLTTRLSEISAFADANMTLPTEDHS